MIIRVGEKSATKYITIRKIITSYFSSIKLQNKFQIFLEEILINYSNINIIKYLI